MYKGEKLLIANRGEIALRILKTAQQIGLATVTIYTPSDALAPHVTLADEAVSLPVQFGESEFNAYCASDLILSICVQCSVTLLHPGYGFLSENAEFADMVIHHGIIWLGPSPDIIKTMGIKHEARRIAKDAGIPVVPGSNGLVKDENEAINIAHRIGFPVMLKATAGGGGMGLVVCNNEEELVQRFESTSKHAKRLFKDSGLFIEHYFPSAHHIEIQVFGDGKGAVVHMGERECSIQRRHQKVLEECPSPFCVLHPGLRIALVNDAVQLCRSIQYCSAGTVEFIVDDISSKHFFLEMNTRIQVEHPITEAKHSNLDIIQMMIDCGLSQHRNELHLFSKNLHQDFFDQRFMEDLHAIEVRVYSENPYDNFKPCSGILQNVDFERCGDHDWLRVDSWISTGTTITPFFDSLLCKIIVTGSTRVEALQRISKILESVTLQGLPNNIDYLSSIILSQAFQKGETTTSFLSRFEYTPQAFTVLAPGLETTIQDLPGRTVGLGVPISGPMDPVAFKLANILVGNNQDVEGLEVILVSGMELALQFHTRAAVAVTGKDVEVELELDGEIETCNMWKGIVVPKNGILRMLVKSAVTGGLRNYVAVHGGLPEIPKYLGSKSTSFGLGGYQGRSLRIGDLIAIGNISSIYSSEELTLPALPVHSIPRYPAEWSINVLNGPHNDPEYVTSAEKLFAINWRISASSNRMGIRLESSEKISWARETGGDGGSHPSNILDNGYAHGTVNINGDTPVILTNEGPDMGGYVCLCTVASGNMWMLGQLSPGDTVKFKPITWDNAQKLNTIWEEWLEDVARTTPSKDRSPLLAVPPWPSSTFEEIPKDLSPKLFTTSEIAASSTHSQRPQVVFRQAGDSAILIEYGPMCLDLTMRARIHAFELMVKKQNIGVIIKFCPCIRSTMCHFDPKAITQMEVLSILIEAENALPDNVTDMVFPGRRFTFPLVLNDQWCNDAIAQYMKTIRSKAVYLPSNIEYLAHNNGLANSEVALQKLVESDHLVLGVGFYLACPFTVPIDPRCRLVGQKMNPSRTYTPRGAIGVAGVVSAIYPIESPGGYQLYGRTLPSWQTWGRGRDFTPDRPWVLQPFDQIHFEVIKEDTYNQLEKDFDAGLYAFKVEDCKFSVKDYTEFVQSIEEETIIFQRKQKEGVFDQEQKEKALLEEWLQEAEDNAKNSDFKQDISDGLAAFVAPLAGMVNKVLVKVGSTIQSESEVLVILEAMKTEIPVKAGKHHVGRVVEALGKFIQEGAMVQSGETLLLLK